MAINHPERKWLLASRDGRSQHNAYSRVSNKRDVTTIYFGIFSNIFIKLEVIFYIIPKKSYVIPNTFIPSPRLYETRDYGEHLVNTLTQTPAKNLTIALIPKLQNISCLNFNVYD